MSIYTRNGYENRNDYLNTLAETYEVPMETVHGLAAVLGPIEDFDGLVSHLSEYQDFEGLLH
jgi:hypothetical protein